MMEFKNQRIIFSKLSKLFAVFGLFLILIAGLVTYYFQAKVSQNELNSKSQLVLHYKQQAFQQYIQESKNILNALKNNKHFIHYLLNNSDKTVSEELFLTMAQGNHEILQVRFLDALGQEKIRINKNIQKNSYFKVKDSLLQNKSHRYYFEEIKSMQDNEIYFSKLDLNIENEKIEMPYVPTLRIGTPLFMNEKFMGALIINLHMKEILNSVISSDIFNVYLVNTHNDIIYSNDESKDNWSTILDIHSRISNENLLRKDVLFQNSSEVVYIGLNVKEKSMHQLIDYSIFMMMFLLIPSSLVFALLLRRKVKYILQNLDEQNRYAIQQVKLESIGKLLENIAHQWRQPLNVISSLSSSSKMMLQMDLLQTKELYQNLDQITTTCIGLSHTIDDFKNFFKMDANITSFRLLDLKDKALEELDDALKKNAIEFITDSHSSNVKIKGSQQTLKHVLQVLIKNSIDAHRFNTIQNRYIFFSTHVNKESIIIKIKDNALGIDESIIDKIFEPYFTTRKELEGKGMGLYVVHQVITQQLNGHIEVENVKFRFNHLMHQGAEFVITLPIKND